jgi:hypothetical protein
LEAGSAGDFGRSEVASLAVGDESEAGPGNPLVTTAASPTHHHHHHHLPSSISTLLTTESPSLPFTLTWSKLLVLVPLSLAKVPSQWRTSQLQGFTWATYHETVRIPLRIKETGPPRTPLTRNEVTKQDIEDHFSTHGTGKIKEVKLMNGFGFIEYDDELDAKDVVPGQLYTD